MYIAFEIHKYHLIYKFRHLGYYKHQIIIFGHTILNVLNIAVYIWHYTLLHLHNITLGDTIKY